MNLMKWQKKALSSPNIRSSSKTPVVRKGTKTTFHCQFNTYSRKNHRSLSVFCFARETASAGKGYNPSGLCSDKTVRDP